MLKDTKDIIATEDNSLVKRLKELDSKLKGASHYETPNGNGLGLAYLCDEPENYAEHIRQIREILKEDDLL